MISTLKWMRISCIWQDCKTAAANEERIAAGVYTSVYTPVEIVSGRRRGNVRYYQDSTYLSNECCFSLHAEMHRL
ncbi:hypothetical protein [Chitinophaga agri]|uniref:Uncharacterized protein n=1 Tax=Chitinophaga agri TaxID=2703787 RepID=A0A6B9ZES1_9BACT|nr:hypothetical protein [Chitinophaga agri]QHS60617.1 hypothetical protein GWR21_13740 [Chitinophaga agri]